MTLFPSGSSPLYLSDLSLPCYSTTDFPAFKPTSNDPSSSTAYDLAYPVPNCHRDLVPLSVEVSAHQPEMATFSPSSAVPTFQSMKSAALVAAALGPSTETTDATPLTPRRRKRAKDTSVSSPPIEIIDDDSFSDTERREKPGHGSGGEDTAKHNKRRRKSVADRIDRHSPNSSRSPIMRQKPISSPRISTNGANLGKEGDGTFPKFMPAPIKLKKVDKRLVRKKPHGIRVPQTLDDAGPADRMMWEWKNMGKSWLQIRNEWQQITGIRPGTSTLSVRYLKLNENFARHGAAGDLQLLRFRREAEEELKDELWARVAEKMLAFSDLSEHNPRELKKRYDYIKRSRAGRLLRNKSVETEYEYDGENGDEETAEFARVKDESDEESHPSKIITFSLPRSRDPTEGVDQDPGNTYADPDLDHSSREASVLEIQPLLETDQSLFDAPFAFNLVDHVREQARNITSEPTKNAPDQTAGGPSLPEARESAGDMRPSDRGVTATSLCEPVRMNRMFVTQMSPPVTSSPISRLASSPFLQSLLAYDLEED